MSRISNLFILGNHIQALGVSRIAAGIGLEVSIFNDSKASVARFSKTCHRFILFNSLEHLLKLLREQKSQANTLIVATNDRLIGFIGEHYEELKRSYFLALPDPEALKICFNKRDTYRIASQIDIPIPDTYFPNSIQDISTISQGLQYPVLLKPAIMYKFFETTGKKVFLCRDASELHNQYQEILKIIPAEEVIIQQLLNGGAKNLYSFGSFFANGQVYGGFVANRIRQKPMDFGISTCFARTVLNPQIEDLSVRFLKSINYFGLSEIEFMWDQDTQTFKLLEINPRTWKWHSITNKLDINLLMMMVRYLEEKPITKKMNKQANIGWIESLTDTYVSFGEILSGRLSLREYIHTLRLPKEFATWSLKDPKPALMYLIMSPYLLFKRN